MADESVWWADEGPKQVGTGGISDSVKALYQKYLGRAPENDQVVNSWIQGTGGNLAAIEQGISGSPEAKAYKPASSGGGGGAFDAGSWISSQLSSAQSTDDPGYWNDKIGSDPNVQNPATRDSALAYWADRIARGDGAAAVKAGTVQKFNDGGGSALSGMSGYRPMASYQPPQAPQYTPYQVTPLKTPDPYKLPTAEEARATPGYQFALEQGTEATKRANVASGNAGGATLKELAQYGTGLADQTYQNTVANSMNAYNTNTGNELNFWGANTNAGLSAAGLNLQGVNQQFQNTYQPSFAAYQSDVAQNQFGANYGLNLGQLGLSAQNQFWNQGFNENQNAFSQYTKQQNDAFDQWYKQAQLGYVGNPYS